MRSRLAELFYKNAERCPDKPAVWCDGKTLSYRELADLVSRYSNLLISLGVEYGDHIAIPMNNSIESAALFFSAADLGVCVVPINASLPFDAIKTAIKAGDVRHIIARRAFFSECEKRGGVEVKGVSICLDREYPGTVPFSTIEKMSDKRPDMAYDVTGNESFILTMTSGSTEKPKPIDISQNNKYERAMAHVRVYSITENDRILAATPLYHSLAERLVILPLLIGASSILLPRFTPEIWLRCVKEQKPTFTIAVSAQLAQIMELLDKEKEIPDFSFRCIVSSSALLETSVKNELIKFLKCEFHEMYGTSEVSTATSICFQKESDKSNSVGRPFDKADICIIKDREGENEYALCKTKEIGEIAVRSGLMCKGYYRQPEKMKEAMFNGYFRTGDLGYLDEDGYLYYCGRKKELIITGAINVYPNDIDSIIGRLPEVEECAAFAYPDERLGEIVAVAIVPKKDNEVDIRKIRAYCAKNLADFQQPHKIFILDSLPKNSMGKLQRRMIYEYIVKLGSINRSL